MRLRRAGCIAILSLAACACSRAQSTPRKAEAVTGTVTGTVICADTNAPARFAVVTLARVPGGKSATERNPRYFTPDNATATTDLEGGFVMNKVPAGQYFVVAFLPGYAGPMSRFESQELRKPSEETLALMLKTVPTVSVEPGQAAHVHLRLEHASELSGTVLYDDGSPAIHLSVQLLRKYKTGEIREADGVLDTGARLFGLEPRTDDRGRYAIMGVTPGQYVVGVKIESRHTQISRLLGGGISFGSSSGANGEVWVFSGTKLRLKDAKLIEVGEGEQLGGLDITIPLAALHTVRGTVTAKRDGHGLNNGRVALLYADDRKAAQSGQLDREGNFELRYVAEDRYILRVFGGEDTEVIEEHQFNSNYTEEKPLRLYGEAEIPLVVQADLGAVEIAVPDAPAAGSVDKKPQ